MLHERLYKIIRFHCTGNGFLRKGRCLPGEGGGGGGSSIAIYTLYMYIVYICVYMYVYVICIPTAGICWCYLVIMEKKTETTI